MKFIFKSFSLGGKSILSKNELVNAAIIPDLINQSFYEKYNYLDINTELSNNLVHYTNYIDQYYHGSVGHSSKENFKIFCEFTSFKLVKTNIRSRYIQKSNKKI